MKPFACRTGLESSINIFRKKIIILFIGFLLYTNQTYAFVHASGKNIVNSDNQTVLKRGMGLGGWLVPEGYMLQFPGVGSPSVIREQITDIAGVSGAERFYERYEANYVTKEDVLKLGEWGFDHIRLPFHYKQFSPSPGVWNEKGFTIVDSMIVWCREAGMHLVLDMHCAPGAQNHGPISDSDGTAWLWLNEGHQDHTVSIWQEIARRYVDDIQIGGYDILNEPVLPQGVTVQQFRNLYIRIVNAIREEDTNHIVFIEGNWYATDFSGLTPPFDSNMAYSFHKYWSTNDQNSIQSFVNLRENYNVPLWMSESGENSNHWFNEAVTLLEENNIGWCWWTHKKYNTVTSPYSAVMPEAMGPLLNYWNSPSTTPKPSQTYAEGALLLMADALETTKCLERPGVIPALFDIDYDFVSKPVKSHILPGVIWATDYDLGGQGVAYSDVDYENNHWDAYTPWNRGYFYRNDGVDIEVSAGSTQPSIGWIEDGEWLNYTVRFLHDGVFDIHVEASNSNETKFLEIELDGQSLGTVAIEPTGSGTNWDDFVLRGSSISTGKHLLKVKVLQGSFNLRQFKIVVDDDLTQELFPIRAVLGQAYPNPFNGVVTIPIQINRSEGLELTIFDMNGKHIYDYDLSGKFQGNYSLIWQGLVDDGTDASTGIYFYQLRTGIGQVTGKVMYLK